MCGVTGWVSYQRDMRELPQRAEVARMARSLRPRGPDAVGAYASKRAAIAVTRLAVIDPAGGSQPMWIATPGGVVVLGYNGELYNFRELRRELETYGDQFRTDSDTEVVLRSYLRWGVDAIDRFNGMFGLAIWDERTEQLLLARDHLGMKPLFFYPTADGVLFGSEPKAILAHSDVAPVVGGDGLRDWVAGTRTPGACPWVGMHEMKPGHVAVLGHNGLLQTRYWTPDWSLVDGAATTPDQVLDLLHRTVESHRIADPTRRSALLLSGGVDSSGIAAVLARQTGDQLASYVVAPERSSEALVAGEIGVGDDAQYAELVAARYALDHHTIAISAERLADPTLIADAVKANDFPPAQLDTSWSQYELFRVIRDHGETIVWSGEAADEVWLGYAQYFKPVGRTTTAFPWLALYPLNVEHTTKTLTPDFARWLDIPNYVDSCFADAKGELTAKHPELAHDDTQLGTYLHITRFVRHMLDRADRTSSAHGLEARFPYGDRRLIEHAIRLPRSTRAPNDVPKGLLKAALSDLLPKPVLTRAKSGYPTVTHQGYAQRIAKLAQAFLGTNDMFHQPAIRELLDQDRPLEFHERRALERVVAFDVFDRIYRPSYAGPKVGGKPKAGPAPSDSVTWLDPAVRNGTGALAVQR